MKTYVGVWTIIQATVGLGLVLMMCVGPSAFRQAQVEVTTAYLAFVLAFQTFFLGRALGIGHDRIAVSTAATADRHASALQSAISALAADLALVSNVTRLQSSLTGELRLYADELLQRLERDLKMVADGILPLTKFDYFRAIIAEMDTMSCGDEVYAVNCIDESRFGVGHERGDPYEIRYMKANELAVTRGVTIHRVFILRGTLPLDKQRQALSEQLRMGVDVRAFWDHTSVEKKIQRDLVLFRRMGEHVAYEDYPDEGDPNRIARGCRYLNGTHVQAIETLCQHAYDLAESLAPSCPQ